MPGGRRAASACAAGQRQVVVPGGRSSRTAPGSPEWGRSGRGSPQRIAIVNRAVLIVFGAFFALLFAGVALALGIGSAPPVPRGAVAIVEGAPPDLNVITRAEFDHEMRVQALEG